MPVGAAASLYSGALKALTAGSEPAWSSLPVCKKAAVSDLHAPGNETDSDNFMDIDAAPEPQLQSVASVVVRGTATPVASPVASLADSESEWEFSPSVDVAEAFAIATQKPVTWFHKYRHCGPPCLAARSLLVWH